MNAVAPKLNFISAFYKHVQCMSDYMWHEKTFETLENCLIAVYVVFNTGNTGKRRETFSKTVLPTEAHCANKFPLDLNCNLIMGFGE